MTENKIPHILIVDDDKAIRNMLSKFLKEHGLLVSVVASGVEMLSLLSRSHIDLVLLDIMMPGENGLNLCRQVQSSSSTSTPIILLTAIDDEADKIVGLELGADDYVTKPFSPRELLARIRTVLRRTKNSNETLCLNKISSYQFSGWRIDINRRTLVSPDSTLIVLTSTEFDLLTIFIENPHKNLSRDRLSDMLHGRASSHIGRSMDVQISRLRRKIELDPQNPVFIKTLRNEGYIFTSDVQPYISST